MPADDPCLGFILPPNVSLAAQEYNNSRSEFGINSHGTAVASALGGARVGIAKNVTIVPIKVIRCDFNSSRARLSNHFYPENKTMFRPLSNGQSYDAIYRCITVNGGTTKESDPGGWVTTPGSIIVDGTVRWQVVAPDKYNTLESTDMIVDGLNWILSANNTTGPKSFAIVTLSVFERIANISGTTTTGITTTIDELVRNLLAHNITVIASANNQNGNACDTSPGRLSRDNPQPLLQGDVITAGGSMIINRPWNVNLNDPPARPEDSTEADGGGGPLAPKGPEPAYDASKAVREGRWICGKGDSDPCANAVPSSTSDPTALNTDYDGFLGGSNAGACVTLFAPAKNLFLATTTGSGSDYRDARLRGGAASGTSWSAPIVAGFAARILQNPDISQGPNHLTPAQVRTALLNNSASTLEDSQDFPLNTVAHDGTPITATPNKVLRLGDVNITAQPASQTATASDSVTLNAQAGGTSTLFYQWYQVKSTFDLASWRNGAHYDTTGNAVGFSSTKILGATSSTYQTLPTSATTGYWMRATNLCGSADTDIAVVTIVPCTPSSITSQPQSVSVPAGTGVTLSVTATGTSLTYQWYVGTSGVTTNPIGGATSASASFTPSSTTTYWVRVSNSCGTADSTAAIVTVQPIVAANFYLITPCRILDTRGGTPVPANGVLNLGVFGKCGVPTGATALAINVTVVSPSTGGLVTLYPGPANTVKPVVSTINYTTGRTLANNARITVGLDGSINMFNAAGTPLDFLIDVSGYFQ
jgi:hypothetical protein